MTTEGSRVLLCDTGFLSRAILGTSPFIEFYQELAPVYQPVISTAIFIELQHWLLLERGSPVNPISRTEYDRHRKRLETLITLNIDGISEQAMNVARRWPDTGVGDCYTIATALVFDVPIFILNPKHFERVVGLNLYKPANYQELLLSVKRSA